MSSTHQRILYLLQNYTAGTASDEEKAELWNWFGNYKDDDGDEIFRNHVEQLLSEYPIGKTENADWERIFSGILAKREQGQIGQSILAPVRRINSFKKWGWVAASAILLTGVTTFFLVNKTRRQSSVAIIQKPDDVLPGSNKAILTLSNGSAIILDSAHDGTLAQQGSTQIIKQSNGVLAYNTLSSLTVNRQPSTVNQIPSTANRQPNTVNRQPLSVNRQPSTVNQIPPSTNTLTTPRGGQYQLLLPDGTKVWLNAASSITYPTAFTGNERKVTITGEAFFVVKHNDKMPFRVVAANQIIEDLGTEFNVNAYSDEPSAKTTLLQGKVKINGKLLKPGQQAVTKNGNTSVNNPEDLEEVVAWKEGQFLFSSADLQTILRQAARWYDVNIEFEGNIKETFTGNISRQVNASQLLHILELTKKVRFEIVGKNIRVIPI